MSMQDTFNEDDIDDLIEEGVVENVYNQDECSQSWE